jgi:tRNA1Val (adenine37-N6)-methyltransferase
VTGFPPHLQETTIFHGRFQCVQPRSGFRFSVDSLILAWFALRNRGGHPFCELGAGSGIVSALLARGGMCGGVAVEMDPTMLECLSLTLDEHGLLGSVAPCPHDLRELPGTLEGGSFQVVVANPPYFPLGEGRVDAQAAEAPARHEFTCTMTDVLAATRYLLPSRGRVFLIYPVLRLSECLCALPAHKLVPTRLQLVHPRLEKRASHFLLEAAKSEGPELVVEEPLITHAPGTAEYGGWYAELLRYVE